MGFLLTRPLRDVTGADSCASLVTIPFLLTRPLRDVTNTAVLSASAEDHFYSHAPCGT